jgi:hypothetical protein
LKSSGIQAGCSDTRFGSSFVLSFVFHKPEAPHLFSTALFHQAQFSAIIAPIVGGMRGMCIYAAGIERTAFSFFNSRQTAGPSPFAQAVAFDHIWHYHHPAYSAHGHLWRS